MTNTNKANPIFEIPLFVFALVCLAALLATVFNSFYWMDDFWKRHELINKGFFQFQWDVYWEWDGRAISPVYTFRNLFLLIFDYPNAWAVALASMSFLIGTGFILSRMLMRENWYSLPVVRRYAMTLLVSFVLILIFRPHISRSVYWATGSYYVFSNFFTVYFLYRIIGNRKSIWNLVWFLVAVSSGPNNGILILTFLVLGTGAKAIQLTKNELITYVGVGMLAMAFVLLAPGNFTRADGNLDFSISEMFIGGFKILYEYLAMSKWAFLGSFIVAVVFARYVPSTNWIWPVLFAASALSSILPFLPIASTASKHTAIFFQTFLFTALVMFWVNLVQRVNVALITRLAGPAKILFLTYFLSQLHVQYITSAHVKNQMDKRHEILEANRGTKQPVELQPIFIPSENWISRFWDLSDESNGFKDFYSKYFEIDEIKVLK
ncbi:MAG TPA: hypothetical protein PKD64_14805 [Pirellulaceae bacterium]|nr:hypothetical protein [Pirellulaceae bacterium]HMO93452.1 hypothetical protein [Pirellulaceae bacterium]HMP68440.1 hypothetical protein [Pirellulaceae bacterium]